MNTIYICSYSQTVAYTCYEHDIHMQLQYRNRTSHQMAGYEEARKEGSYSEELSRMLGLH